MSKDWTPEEISAASKAMEAAGELGYEDFCIMLNITEFARVQSKLYPVEWTRALARQKPCPRTMDSRQSASSPSCGQ